MSISPRGTSGYGAIEVWVIGFSFSHGHSSYQSILVHIFPRHFSSLFTELTNLPQFHVRRSKFGSLSAIWGRQTSKLVKASFGELLICRRST